MVSERLAYNTKEEEKPKLNMYYIMYKQTNNTINLQASHLVIYLKKNINKTKNSKIILQETLRRPMFVFLMKLEVQYGCYTTLHIPNEKYKCIKFLRKPLFI